MYQGSPEDKVAISAFYTPICNMSHFTRWGMLQLGA